MLYKYLGYRRWGLKSAIATFIFVCVAYLISSHNAKNLADIEKALAIEACLAENTELPCKETIETNHQRCFDLNYSPGSKYNHQGFNRAQYRLCLKMGPEVWLQEKQDRLARDRKLARELLE